MALFGAAGVLVTAATLDRLGRTSSSDWTLGLLAASPVAFGSVLLTRFDLVPAALVASATLLLISGRPRVAAVVLGGAAAVKLYPLVLLPLLAAWVWRRSGRRKSVLVSAWALGVVVAAYLPFLVLAPGDVGESVWRQISRPLQIESLGAGLLIVLHRLSDLDVVVGSSFGSQNITGGVAASVAVGLSVLAVTSLGWTWFAFARGEAEQERLVRYGAATLVTLVAFGKVLSPQFLVWLLFPLALVAGRRGAAAAACFAAAALATAVWFPWRYFDLARDLDLFAGSLVLLRGVALVAAFAILVYPLRRSRARSPGSAKPNLR